MANSLISQIPSGVRVAASCRIKRRASSSTKQSRKKCATIPSYCPDGHFTVRASWQKKLTRAELPTRCRASAIISGLTSTTSQTANGASVSNRERERAPSPSPSTRIHLRGSQPRQKGKPSAFQCPAERRVFDPPIPAGKPSDLHRNSSGVSNTASARTQRTSPEIVRPQRACAASATALIMMAANQVGISSVKNTDTKQHRAGQ